MKNPLISVIVPVYNREKTLKRCLDSILKSTFSNIEVIVVDDGSTDNSWDIITSYRNKDGRVKAIHTENGGLSFARNNGLRCAIGEYISFVDADDYISCNIYEKCCRVVDAHHPDMISFNYAVAFEGKEDTYVTEMNKVPIDELLDRDFILDKILPTMVNLTSNLDYFIHSFVWLNLYKRSIIEKYALEFDETRKIWEDRIFKVWFLKFANSFYSLKDVGYYYVIGGSQYTGVSEGRFEVILHGQNDYMKILGDMYDFDIPYTYQYYFQLLNNTLFERFNTAGVSKNTLNNCFKIITNSEEAFKIFTNYEPRNSFEMKVKSAVLLKNIDLLYTLYDKENKKRKKLKKYSDILKLVKGLPKALLRRIVKR